MHPLVCVVFLAAGLGLTAQAPTSASTHYNATFDDIKGKPYYGAPYLGAYRFYAFRPSLPPPLPKPYKALAWENFYVISGQRGGYNANGQRESYHERPVLEACSGNNTIIGFRNEGMVHKISTGYTNSTAKAFTLSSCCVGCFVDIDGNAQGYGYYYGDDKIAANCTMIFTAETAGGGTKSVSIEYGYGAKKMFDDPHLRYRERRMVRAEFGQYLANATEVSVSVEKVAHKGGFFGQPYDGPGHVVLMVLDSCEYEVFS